MNDSKTAGIEKPRAQGGGGPHLIQELVRTYQVLIASLSRETGMPSSRFALMRLLADAEADVGIMDLARQLGVNAAAVTRQVQELERERLVVRRADSKDGRRTHLRLSPKGRKLLDWLLQCSRDFEQSLSVSLSAEEMTSAALVLTKLRTFLEGFRRERREGDR